MFPPLATAEARADSVQVEMFVGFVRSNAETSCDAECEVGGEGVSQAIEPTTASPATSRIQTVRILRDSPVRIAPTRGGWDEVPP